MSNLFEIKERKDTFNTENYNYIQTESNEVDYKEISTLLEGQTQDEDQIRQLINYKSGQVSSTPQLRNLEKQFEEGFYNEPKYFVSSSYISITTYRNEGRKENLHILNTGNTSIEFSVTDSEDEYVLPHKSQDIASRIYFHSKKFLLTPGQMHTIVVYYRSEKNGIFRNRLNIETNPRVADRKQSFIKVYGIVQERKQEDILAIDSCYNSFVKTGRDMRLLKIQEERMYTEKLKTEMTVNINYAKYSEVAGYFKDKVDPSWLDLFLSLINKINLHQGKVEAEFDLQKGYYYLTQYEGYKALYASITDLQTGDDAKINYSNEQLDEQDNNLNAKIEECSANVTRCFMTNEIEEFSVDYILTLLKEVKSAVWYRLFYDQFLALKERLNNLQHVNKRTESGLRNMVLDIAGSVEGVFAQTFETMECTSVVEFGYIKNHFSEKVPDKSKKQKLAKYEDMNIEDLKNNVANECHDGVHKVVDEYINHGMVKDNYRFILDKHFVTQDSVNDLNRSKRISDVTLESCVVFVDIDETKLNIYTEKSKKKNVPSKVVKAILNEAILAPVRDAINTYVEANVKNIFIVAEYDYYMHQPKSEFSAEENSSLDFFANYLKSNGIDTYYWNDCWKYVDEFLEENPAKETRDRLDEVKDKFAQVTILENLNFCRIYDSSLESFKHVHNGHNNKRMLDIYSFLGKLSGNIVLDNAFWNGKSHPKSMNVLCNHFSTQYNYYVGTLNEMNPYGYIENIDFAKEGTAAGAICSSVTPKPNINHILNEFIDHLSSLSKLAKVSEALLWGETMCTDSLALLSPSFAANVHVARVLNHYISDKNMNFDVTKQCFRVDKEVRNSACSFFECLFKDEEFKSKLILPTSYEYLEIGPSSAISIATLWKEAKNKVESDYKLRKIKKKDIDAIEYVNELVLKLYEAQDVKTAPFSLEEMVKGEWEEGEGEEAAISYRIILHFHYDWPTVTQRLAPCRILLLDQLSSVPLTATFKPDFPNLWLKTQSNALQMVKVLLQLKKESKNLNISSLLSDEGTYYYQAVSYYNYAMQSEEKGEEGAQEDVNEVDYAELVTHDNEKGRLLSYFNGVVDYVNLVNRWPKKGIPAPYKDFRIYNDILKVKPDVIRSKNMIN